MEDIVYDAYAGQRHLQRMAHPLIRISGVRTENLRVTVDGREKWMKTALEASNESVWHNSLVGSARKVNESSGAYRDVRICFIFPRLLFASLSLSLSL